MRHARLTILLYQRLAVRYGSGEGGENKRRKDAYDMKASQVEESLLQEQRSLEELLSMDINDPELYAPVED